jgi:hypothetical protein
MTTLAFPRVPYENQQVSNSGHIWIWNGFAWDLLADGATGGGGTSLEVSDTAPTDPDSGSLWFNSLDGNLYVYYQDNDSGQWIQPASSPYGSGSSGGGATFTGGLVPSVTTFASSVQFQNIITAAPVANIIPFRHTTSSSFPAAVGNQGALAHNEADGRLYAAHNGAWNPLANLSDLNSLPVASISVSGAVKVDGTTITISNGVISSTSTGTIASGLAGHLAYYPSNGTGIDDISAVTWANNRLSVTGTITATGQQSIVRSYYPDIVTLQGSVNASTYSGALAYSAAQAHVYVANGSVWTPLANLGDITNSFYLISVAGQEDIVAATTTQALTLVAGANVSILSNNASKELTNKLKEEIKKNPEAQKIQEDAKKLLEKNGIDLQKLGF